MERLKQFCFSSLADVLKVEVKSEDTIQGDYMGTGSFEGVIAETNRHVASLLASLYSLNGDAFTKTLGPSVGAESRLDPQLRRIHELYTYGFLTTFLRVLGERESFNAPGTATVSRLIWELLESTKDQISYNNQYQFIVSRVLARRNHGGLERPAPSLELGIGGGETAHFVHGPGRGATIGIDPVVGFVRSARNLGDCKHYLCGDAAAIPFQDDVFQTVTASYMVYLVYDKRKAIQEMARVTAPGGSLVFDDITSSFMTNRPWYALLNQMDLKESARMYRRHFLRDQEYLSPSDYRDIVGADFSEVKVIPFYSRPLLVLSWLFWDLDHIFMRTGYGLSAEVEKDYRAIVDVLIAPLIARDQQSCEEEGGHGYQLVVARKGGIAKHSVKETEILDHLKCSSCGAHLEILETLCRCEGCGMEYPIVDGIPLLIPFYIDHFKKLKGYAAHKNDAGSS